MEPRVQRHACRKFPSSRSSVDHNHQSKYIHIWNNLQEITTSSSGPLACATKAKTKINPNMKPSKKHLEKMVARIFNLVEVAIGRSGRISLRKERQGNYQNLTNHQSP